MWVVGPLLLALELAVSAGVVDPLLLALELAVSAGVVGPLLLALELAVPGGVVGPLLLALELAVSPMSLLSGISIGLIAWYCLVNEVAPLTNAQ